MFLQSIGKMGKCCHFTDHPKHPLSLTVMHRGQTTESWITKQPHSRRVEYVMDRSMDQSVSESVSERCMYVTPIRSGLLWTANQISCLVNGMWEDSIPIQFRTAILEEKVFISSFSVGYAEDFSYGRDEPWGLRQCVSYKGNMILLFFTRSKFN